MTNNKLTIIITTFKSEDKIEGCLNSIDSTIKVIIIENSNNQKFKDYIEKKYLNAECILTNQNLGYGKANNIGLKKANTKYCLILNPDTILDKQAIRSFISSSKKNKNFFIMGPVQTKDEFYRNNTFKNNFDLLEVNHIEGFAMFLNMEKFSNIGFFDENFFLFLEEIDLCKRVKKINGSIIIDPNIKIFHYKGKAVNDNFSDEIELTRNWHWMWSLFYFNKKHFGFIYALVKILPKFFSSLIKAIFYFFIFSKKKKIYLCRISGIINSIFNRSSWYRPNIF